MSTRRCAAEGCSSLAGGSIGDLGYCFTAGHVARVIERAAAPARTVRALARTLRRAPSESLPPVARADDPHTSYLAEAELSEKRIGIVRRVYAFVVAHPGRTSGEISEGLGMEHHEVWRRVSDAKSLGLIYASGKRLWEGSGRQQGCLWPVVASPTTEQARLL